MHDRVELPEPVTLAGVRVQAVLLLARLTTPANPFRPVTVMDEVPGEPARTVTVVGLAAMVKSCTVYKTLVKWESVLLVPVTLTSIVLAVPNVHDSVEVPDVVTLVGVRVQAVLLLARFTTPVKPLRGVMVMVEVPGLPTLTVTDVGLADIAKSGIALKVTVTL